MSGWADMDADRFWARVDASGDCWTWTGAMRGTGYGAFYSGGNNFAAHRVAWELLVGLIPEGLHLDHLCRNRACVNPDHLDPVPARVNILRGYGPTAMNARRSHCPRGHEYTLKGNGTRYCRECQKNLELSRRAAGKHRQKCDQCDMTVGNMSRHSKTHLTGVRS